MKKGKSGKKAVPERVTKRSKQDRETKTPGRMTSGHGSEEEMRKHEAQKGMSDDEKRRLEAQAQGSTDNQDRIDAQQALGKLPPSTPPLNP
jgi:hypothetical protein